MTILKLSIWALCGLGALPASPPSAQELSDATFLKWKDFILSKPEQLTWKTAIAWEQNLGQGILKSIKGDKPMLLWVEAGDPQGCV